jgi:hypothetical protein
MGFLQLKSVLAQAMMEAMTVLSLNIRLKQKLSHATLPAFHSSMTTILLVKTHSVIGHPAKMVQERYQPREDVTVLQMGLKIIQAVAIRQSLNLHT